MQKYIDKNVKGNNASINYTNNRKEQGWLKPDDRRALSRSAQIMTPTQLQPPVYI